MAARGLFRLYLSRWEGGGVCDRLAEDARKHEERMALQERKNYEYRGMEP